MLLRLPDSSFSVADIEHCFGKSSCIPVIHLPLIKLILSWINCCYTWAFSVVFHFTIALTMNLVTRYNLPQNLHILVDPKISVFLLKNNSIVYVNSGELQTLDNVK